MRLRERMERKVGGDDRGEKRSRGKTGKRMKAKKE